MSFAETTPGYQNANEEFTGAIQNEVIFSENGGLKTQTFQLSLSGNESSQKIHYTTNGSEPNALSPIYSNPIQVTENTSVRARIYAENYLPSKTVTESYTAAHHVTRRFF